MIAPLDPVLTTSHPKFEALYRDLCTNKVNSDATSKLDPKAQKERDSLSEEIHKARVASARKALVRNGLQYLAYAPSALPGELQELVAVVAALLDDQITEEDRLLLQDDLVTFKRSTKTIASALSTAFQDNAGAIAAMLDHGDTADHKNLLRAISDLKASIAADGSKTAEARFDFTQEATALHDIYRQIIEACIRTLEQTIHGSVARGTKAKADYLATVAEGMSKKLELQRSQFAAQLYSEDVQEALRMSSGRLEKESGLMKVRIRDAEGQLQEYGKASEIKGMAVEYAEILRETEKVKAEVERLQGNHA